MTKPTLRAVEPRKETTAERAARAEAEAMALARDVIREMLEAQEQTRLLALTVVCFKNIPPGVTQEAEALVRGLEASRKRVAAILDRG